MSCWRVSPVMPSDLAALPSSPMVLVTNTWLSPCCPRADPCTTGSSPACNTCHTKASYHSHLYSHSTCEANQADRVEGCRVICCQQMRLLMCDMNSSNRSNEEDHLSSDDVGNNKDICPGDNYSMMMLVTMRTVTGVAIIGEGGSSTTTMFQLVRQVHVGQVLGFQAVCAERATKLAYAVSQSPCNAALSSSTQTVHWVVAIHISCMHLRCARKHPRGMQLRCSPVQCTTAVQSITEQTKGSVQMHSMLELSPSKLADHFDFEAKQAQQAQQATADTAGAAGPAGKARLSN